MSERRVGDDEGFTLMEVIVALSLLAIVATASLVFFVNGTRSVTSQQRSQSAIAVATNAMEQTFSRVPTTSATGVSGLVVGRTKADVDAAWAAAGPYSVPGLSDTYPAWDTATAPAPAVGTGDDAVKLTTTTTQAKITYTTTTLIGTCYRVTTNPSGPCTKTGGTSAGVANAGYSALMRVAVLVTWPDVAGRCTPSGTCSYSTTSLIDPSSDLKWNNTTRLVAADDAVSTDALTPITIDVLDNDTLMSITSNPVSVYSQPVKASTGVAMGSAAVNTDGTITYTPTTDAHGEVTFAYRVTVGARVAQALVHVYVKPLAADYTIGAIVGTPVDQAVTTRAGDTPKSVSIESTPASGTVSLTGSPAVTLHYVPGAVGTYSYTYTYTDAEGMVSLPGTVTYTVVTYSPPNATNPGPVAVAASATPAPVVMQLQTRTGNPTTYLAKVTSLPAVGTVQVDGATIVAGQLGTAAAIGSNVTYTPPAKTSQVSTFTATLLTPDMTQESAPVTATVQVTPVVADDGTKASVLASVSRGSTVSLNIGANDWSYKGLSIQVVQQPQKFGSSTSCGTLTTSNYTTNGTVSFKAGWSSVTDCRFTYTITDSKGAVSNVATVYLKVP